MVNFRTWTFLTREGTSLHVEESEDPRGGADVLKKSKSFAYTGIRTPDLPALTQLPYRQLYLSSCRLTKENYEIKEENSVLNLKCIRTSGLAFCWPTEKEIT